MPGQRADAASVDPGLRAQARRAFDANVRLRRALGDEVSVAAALDVLLFLLADDTGNGVTTTNCCSAMVAPRTTALRWIAALASAGLVRQREDPADRRVTLLCLTTRAHSLLSAWLHGTGGAAAAGR